MDAPSPPRAEFEPAGSGEGLRRRLERDPHGTVVTRLAWTGQGRLAEAFVRLPGGGWLRVESAAVDTAAGRCDRVWRVDEPGGTDAGEPLTVFTAIDYGRVDHIPPLADPERLPPGGGTAILNLLATLAADQRRARLAYHGPYPTEQLFLALLECFRYVPPAGDEPPLAAFTRGALAWEPAPHERIFAPAGVYVQRRGRIEKVVWEGRAYLRPDWQDVARHAPRRLRDTPAGVIAGLWACGAPLEDHLLVAPDAAGAEPLAVVDDPAAPGPMAPALAAGVVELAAAMSAPALAPFVRAVGGELALAWGPVPRDLVAVTPAGLRVATRLRARLAEVIAAAPAETEAAARALAGVGELARLLGDELRRRARDRVASLAPDEQRRVLGAPASDGADAARVIDAARALLRETS